MINIQQVRNKKELRTFIRLPYHLHKYHPKWVPPLLSDEWDYFNPAKNKAFSYCDTAMAIAFMDGKPAGRIMGVINHRYNSDKGEKKGRFSMFECIQNRNVADNLLRFAENWAAEQGMEQIIGPYGMNYFDPEGFLTWGFEHEPTITTNYNFEYMNIFLEEAGYSVENEYVVYKIDLPNKIPDIYFKIRNRILQNDTFRLLEFTSRRELRLFTRPILELMNECFNEIYGFSYLSVEEIDLLGRKYISMLDPRFIKVALTGDKMAGFIIAMPNLSPGFRRSKGHLFPFGFFHLMRALKNSKQIDLLMGGIKKEFRAKGVDVLMGLSMIESAVNNGFKIMDSHHELASNYKVRAEMERMGGIPYKKFTVFQKELPLNQCTNLTMPSSMDVAGW